MTTARLMRTLLPSSLLRQTRALRALPLSAATHPNTITAARCDLQACLQHCRCLAHAHPASDPINRSIWFTSSAPQPNSCKPDHQPPDKRTLQLGKTVRLLHERLPTLLQSPLPSEILSPQISLHLFPSTHPHLPTVSGRIAYNAALCTAPVAWGRVPLVGNVRLTILSERMVRNGRGYAAAAAPACGEEKLIVKWKTCGKDKTGDGTGGVYGGGVGARDPVEKIRHFISGTSTSTPRGEEEERQEFTGLFIFSFDDEGRLLKHVIEHTEEGGHWDHMTRVVSVTDWLLGRWTGKAREGMPELALCEERPTGQGIRLVDRRVARME